MLHIHSIETFGTHEGPGIRLVLFLQGCNINCLYCHNPDTKILTNNKEVSNGEILKLLEKQKPYFAQGGGLSLSGGEPTLQAVALIDLVREVKAAGFNVALDTNGTIVSDAVKCLYDLVDLVLLDIKQIDSDWHRKLTGVGNETVLELAAYREKSGKSLWLRYVLVPGYTDQEEHLQRLGEHFRDYSTIERIEVLPYHTFGVYKYDAMGAPYHLQGVRTPDANDLAKAQEILKQYFKEVIIR